MTSASKTSTKWATADEREAFLDTLAPFATYDFRIRDEFDNGEFITGATVDLYERGILVHTETFTISSEDAYGPDFSAYGNGRDNHASTQARSYAWAWIESRETPLEIALSPFGTEWEREQIEAGVTAVYA